MTLVEFNNYKLQIQYIMSKKAAALANYLAIGKQSLDNDIVNLDLLGTYMDITETYDLEAYDSEDPDNEDTINFFTRDEMQSVVTHINKICSTHYNIDFILES
jgi:hypothetical protein